MFIPRTRRALAPLLLAGIAVLASHAPAASAMPPAHGLSAAQEKAADAVLEDAVERGVGELPASPFLRQTACGTADSRWRSQSKRLRVAVATLRQAQRAGRSTRSAARRVAAQRKLLATAAARRAKLCVPRSTATKVEDDTTLTGTTTSERPRSMVVGTGMVVALPIEFSDVRANRTTHPTSAYEELLFGSSNSLNAFYRDMSYGSFSVQGDVQPWRRLDKRRGQYADGEGGMGAYPGNSQSMLEDAVAAYDGTVDFAKYDNDGPDGKPNSGDDDGFVDSVVLIFAGTSSAETGNLGSIWPHAWRQTVATKDASRNGGTIKVGRYAAVPERMEERGANGDLLSLGIVAHEYGHTLGLPDLIDGEDGAGAGKWDLMGSGMWGFQDASRPTGLSAWSRARLGWVTPQLLSGDHLAHRLGSSYAQRSIAKLPIDGAPLHEHFLVERRSQTGFDADAPGSGLLVWHVDDSISPDDASGHPRVELVAADGIADGNVGDLLSPGGALGDSTDPDTKSHAGRDSLVAIQNVGDLTVDLHAGKASLAPVIDASTETAGPQAAFPTAVLTAPVAGSRLRGTVTMSCDGAGNPNVNRISFRRSGTNLTNVNVTPSAASTTKTYNWNTGTLNGNYTMTCAARNTSNQTTTSAGVAVVLDNTVPGTPTMTSPAVSPAWLRGTVSWDATATDNYGVTNFSYRVDGVDNWQTAWTEVSPKSNTISWDTTAVANGNHTLTVRAQDLAGNLSAVSANRAVRVDNAAPVMSVPTDGATLPDIDTQVSITALNARWTAATDANSGMSSYTWRFCTSPACTTVVASGGGAGLTATAGSLSLAVGTYYTCVKAIDVAGNQSADFCSDGVVVDNVAPTMSVPMDAAVAPDLDYQSSTNTLNAVWVAANDGAGTGVALYDWRFCTSPACGTVLASGSGAGLTATAGSLTLANATTYFACVRARDQLANISAYTCSDGITVDTGVPTMTTPMDGAAAPDKAFQTSTTSLSAVWTAGTDAVSGVASYDWRFCTLPACGTILASGNTATLTATAGSLTLTGGTTYYACVRSRDNVGLTSAYVCSNGITVDSGPPTMTTPTDGNPAPDVDFQSSATTLAAVWTAATDGGSGVASYDWRFCSTSTACGTVIASGSGAGLSATANSLTLVNGTTYFACVRAVDNAGNQSAYVCSDGVVADLAPPTMTVPNDGATAPDIDTQVATTSLAANWTAASDGAGSGVASYDWRFCAGSTGCGSIVASGSGAGTTASATGLTLVDGVTYYSCVRATDQLGQASAYTCSDGLVVDSAPAVTITAPTNGAGVTGTVNASATATDGGGITKVEWRLDGALQQTNNYAAFSPRTSTWSWNTTTATEGTHTILVTAYDAGGATGTDTITVIVDRTAPSASHGGITADSIVTGTVNFTSSSSDSGGLDRVDYWIDGSSVISKSAGGATSFNDPGTPFSTLSLLEGNHWYLAAAYDVAGNETLTGPPETHFVVNNNVEGVLPTGTITAPANGATLTPTNVTLTANVSDNNAIVKIEFLLDGVLIPNQVIVPAAGYSGGSRSKTWSNTTGVSAGPHTISARVTDASGNTYTTATVNVTK